MEDPRPISDWNKRHATSRRVRVVAHVDFRLAEASWGADPLEYHYGGFRKLEFDPDATFRSSLANDGVVSWSKTDAVDDDAKTGATLASSTLNVQFPNIQWDRLRAVYGWQATQFQAWARGQIHVDAPKNQTVVLYTDSVLEYWIDGVQYFGGDYYSWRRAPPVLQLTPGSHRVDVRLVRDVRSMGGTGEPTMSIKMELKSSSQSLEFADREALISDIVRNSLVGEYGSVAVRNAGEKDVRVVGVYDPAGVLLISGVDGPVTIRPGQTRPIIFKAQINYLDISPNLSIAVEFKDGSEKGNQHQTITLTQDYHKKKDTEPHKMTYLHPGGIVSYAIIRAPSKAAISAANGQKKFPVLLSLHGAGVEADDPLVAHALDPLPNLEAWALFPSGVTPNSGDDWHNWGAADVEAAIKHIPQWIKNTGWNGPGVDTNSWFVSGHSNGGQGTWYLVTHQPDKVFAAAPISGYASIQTYVPYDFWAPMEPARRSILDASLNSYRHEVLAGNCKSIPIQLQHSDLDMNVPTYHSRLMNLQLFEAGVGSAYTELPGKHHWFDGVMTTEDLREFYRAHLNRPFNPSSLPKKFSITVANPGDMGAKGGLRVLQVETPGRYGHMDVTVTQLNEQTCMYDIQTTNVKGFEVGYDSCSIRAIVIDGTKHQMTASSSDSRVFWKSKDQWQFGTVDPTGTPDQLRKGRQLGALDAILRTQGHFTIAHAGAKTYPLALQISRNLFQYFYADSEIVSSLADDKKQGGNRITVATGTQLPAATVSSFPINIKSSKVSVKDYKGRIKEYSDEGGLAAIFLRPRKGQALELVVWGSDAEAAARAARLVPMMTGVGQPDFIILSKSSLWKGVQGAVALGFLDHEWKVAETSLLTA